MSQGAMLTWFVLTALSLAFVAIDIRSTPAHPVIKAAFVILAVFTGPFAAFFYVLGCREPLRGTHEEYVAARWRQVLGSTMHCAAGDGIGILAGAALAAHWHLPAWADFSLEYVLGFGFGWTIFQAFAMRDMAGGDYLRSLRQTFLPEFLSMNLLMAGMLVTMHALMPHIAGGGNPMAGGFWLVMSMALIAGFILAYPINWWLVAKGLKHGMITVRPRSEPMPRGHAASAASTAHEHSGSTHAGHGEAMGVSVGQKAGMTILSLVVLALGVAVTLALDR